MASGLAVSRVAVPVNHGGTRTPNLPVIEHPMAKLGNKNELAIRGSSSVGHHNDLSAGQLRHSIDLGVRNTSSMSSNANKGLRASIDMAPGQRGTTPQERMIHWPPEVAQARIAERLLFNEDGLPLSPLCEFVAPFTYRRSAAERVGLVKEEKPKKDKKKTKGLFLPPIDTVQDEDPSGANLKMPSLATFMDFVEDDLRQDYLSGPRGAKTRPKPDSAQCLTNRSTVEVVDMVRDKLATGFSGLKHLFRANDPTGQGNEVSREAFLRILYSLCGYISTDQYTKFMKQLGLDGKESITFDAFIGCFRDNESVKKQWVSPIQRIQIEKENSRRLLESGLRNSDFLEENPFLSAPFSDSLFKQKVRTLDDARRVFPAACFTATGMIVPPQLREAYAQCGIYMTDKDFDTLWQRYDKQGLGAVWTEQFLKRLGVLPGRPSSYNATELPKPKPHESLVRPKSENISKPPVKSKQRKTKETEVKDKPEMKEEPGNSDPQQTAAATNDNKPAPTEQKEDPGAKVKIPKKSRKAYPKLDNIIDCLHYRFEESYNAMLTACQLFDFMSDNYVSRVDFRRILQEFGFTITVTEMDSFLARIGIRSIRSQINYRELLNKFQSRGESSITNKIVTNRFHMFQSDTSTSQGGLSAEDLEAKLVEYFHGDFIKLISHFRTCDKYGLGVITGHEFKSGIERRLGYGMSEKQWEQLQADVGKDQDGLIPYTKFLQLFDVIPGSWNRKLEDGVYAAHVPQTEMGQTAEVERLREKAKTTMVPQEMETPKMDNTRTVADIVKLVEELFRNRFHTFDKHFKEMDRKMIGRMSKWQLGALLKLSGLTLAPKEVDQLWGTLNVAPDGMYSFSSLIKHFVQFKVTGTDKKEEDSVQVFREEVPIESYHPQPPPPPPKPQVRPELHFPLPTVPESTKEQIEQAKKIQKERKERRKAEKEAEEPRRPISTVQQPSPTLSQYQPPGSSMSVMSTKSVRTKELLVKIKQDVVKNWEGLKSVFKFIDKSGFANITLGEMKEVMDTMNFNLTREEKEELCQRFDLQRNGRFHYLEFMKCFSQRPGNAERAKTFVYSKHTHKLERKQGGMDVTVANVLNDMREKFMAEHKNLRRAFKKLDVKQKGYLSIHDFRKALKACDVDVSNEDFYHLMTEFDRNITGRISYDNFISTFIDV